MDKDNLTPKETDIPQDWLYEEPTENEHTYQAPDEPEAEYEEEYKAPAPAVNPYASYYGGAEEKTPGQDGNSSTFGNLASFNTLTPVTAAKRSFTPLIIALVCLVAAAAGVLGWYFFLRGGYEVAERIALRDFVNSVTSYTGGDQAAALSIKITPSGEFTDITGISDIEALSFNIETITENSDFYAKLGVNGLSMDLSAMLWMLEEGTLAHFPELSEYYLLIMNLADNAEMRGMMDIYNDEALMKEFNTVLNKTLDRYFELTKSVRPTKNHEVTLGDISHKADKYSVRIDGEFMLEVAEAFIENLLKSRKLMNMLDDIFKEMFVLTGMRGMSFTKLLEEALDSFGDMPDRAREQVIATMNVYVSGRKVLKRELVVSDDFGRTTITIITLGKGRDYAHSFELRQSRFRRDGAVDETRTVITDIGTADKNKGKTGEINIRQISGSQTVTHKITYEDFDVNKNGLWSGRVDARLTLGGGVSDTIGGLAGTNANGTELRLSMDFSVSGDTQTSKTSVSWLERKIADIDAELRINTGGKIPAPANTAGNTLDMNDWRDRDRFTDDVMGTLFAMFAELAGSVF
jgi:hypothetical protein